MIATLTPNTKGNPTLEKLLKTYVEVFKEVKTLPPFRLHDHYIPLKERA
jgi:hypothetical protein